MKKSLLIKALLAVSQARIVSTQPAVPSTPTTAPPVQKARGSYPNWCDVHSMDE